MDHDPSPPPPRPPARSPPSPRLLLPQRCPKLPRQVGSRVHAGAVPEPRGPAPEFQLPAAALCARAAPPPASGPQRPAPRGVTSRADLRRAGVHIGVREL